MLESVFTYAGHPRHEILLIHEAVFDDVSVCNLATITGHESDGSTIAAEWRFLEEFGPDDPLVPEGLLELLTMRGR